MEKLTNLLPNRRVTTSTWEYIRDLDLADPSFGQPARIDCILGADVYGLILRPNLRHGPPGLPTAQETVFGWILSGTVNTEESCQGQSDSQVSIYHCATESSLSDDLRRFWDLEALPTKRIVTPDDEFCERHFLATHSRDATGRYLVRLPFKDPGPRALGESKGIATTLQLHTEKRLQRDHVLASKYHDFMREYEDLGHMLKVNDDGPDFTYYMPHHAVVKSNDPSGKVRIVFNASQRSSSGISLNEVLHTGPKLQTDLWVIITRWRFLRFAFTADIVKMYRQILVHPQDADLQRIVWRPEPSGPIEKYRLTTVTYGMAAAPFLALRVLRQLAQDERASCPDGARSLELHSYVDDILSGGDTLVEARHVQQDLVQILNKGGFELSKWASNDARLLPDRALNSQTSGDKKINTDLTASVSTLGLRWNPDTDYFHFQVAVPPELSTYSKRSVLSEIARLFDPMGWLAPFTIRAKILLQDCWLAGIDWDSELPLELGTTWASFRADLPAVDHIRIPRWAHTESNLDSCELHGFCDASQRAYAAAVYIVLKRADQEPKATLLMARTKVAPVQTISVPRLELCGALLLSRLMSSIIRTLDMTIPTYCWTDSQTVRAWLQGHPSKWVTFVANRVSEIHENLASVSWNHVASADNPADCATRGLSSEDLKNSCLWWTGPDWLTSTSYPLETSTSAGSETQLEMRRSAQVHVIIDKHHHDLPARCSTFSKLIRVTAYCLRFIANLRLPREQRETGHLQATELHGSTEFWIKRVQREHFSHEIRDISNGKQISRQSRLLRLAPFLDDRGILRVGGRLTNSNLSYDERHPRILPHEDRTTQLLVLQAHLQTLHGGPQLMLSHLLRRYWILGAKPLINRTIRGCIRCTRFRGRPQNQIMGDLPADRVTPARPFLHAGVDYAGPIAVRTSKGRGHQATKGYICLFVCMVTKAVHLEVVSDLTAKAFLGAFRRFTSRRGHCVKLYSDNGTTFVGADRELRNLCSQASETHAAIANELEATGTSWVFIPPRAPHFGGIWEAGVKAVKYHMHRAIGDSTLTFEELTTLLCQIEACLNSRPLYPISNDPMDLAPLTPGHFLVGHALTQIPEPSALEKNPNSLPRWDLITHLRDSFWSRWTRDYLNHLQQRSKWVTAKRNLQLGDMVLIMDELRPPARWNLGRVIQTHPGADGHVRVVTLRTASGSLKRPVAKLCLLPVPSDDAVAPGP